jgi:hypothetical protein
MRSDEFVDSTEASVPAERWVFYGNSTCGLKKNLKINELFCKPGYLTFAVTLILSKLQDSFNAYLTDFHS